jgi:hypothetical protein
MELHLHFPVHRLSPCAYLHEYRGVLENVSLRSAKKRSIYSWTNYVISEPLQFVSRTCVARLCCWQYSYVHSSGGQRDGAVWNTEKWSPWETYFLFSSAASLGFGDGRKIINPSLSSYSSRFVRSFQNFLLYSCFLRNSSRELILVLVFMVFIELASFLLLY